MIHQLHIMLLYQKSDNYVVEQRLTYLSNRHDMLNAMLLPVLVLVLAPPMIHNQFNIYLDCYISIDLKLYAQLNLHHRTTVW